MAWPDPAGYVREREYDKQTVPANSKQRTEDPLGPPGQPADADRGVL